MPNQKRDRSWSHDRSRSSPYANSRSSRKDNSRSSRKDKQHSSRVVFSNSEEDLREWEGARCSVCMEHPHNAVLLVCSSHKKGCRPYMCDTSYRHSNCLDQFCKASGVQKSLASPSEMITERGARTMQFINSIDSQERNQTQAGDALHIPAQCDSEQVKMISCPLCRGQVEGWIVNDEARQFMNAKARSCSSEACPFGGNYADLRKHARNDHPQARPTEVDQERKENWRRLERQRDLGDVLSSLRSSILQPRVWSDDEDAVADSVLVIVVTLRRSYLVIPRAVSSSPSEDGGDDAD